MISCSTSAGLFAAALGAFPLALCTADVEILPLNLAAAPSPPGLNRDASRGLDALNRDLESLRSQLHQAHQLASLKCQEGASPESLQPLVKRAAHLRQQLRDKEQEWRQLAKSQSPAAAEQSASWHFPEITLYQLIVEFGSQEHLYLIPPEIASQKVSVVAGFAIPRASWPDLVEWVLAQQGLATRPLNAFCRQIYSLADRSPQIDAIVQKCGDLGHFSPEVRLCLVYKPAGQTQLTLSVLREFAHRDGVQLHLFADQIALIGRRDALQQLLEIADVVVQRARAQTFQIITLQRVSAKDAERALGTLQSGFDAPGSASERPSIGLRALAFEYSGGESLLLVGSREEIDSARQLIEKIEEQIDRESGRQLLWHRCKHEQPSVLAEIALQLCDMLGDQEQQVLQAPKEPAPKANLPARATGGAHGKGSSPISPPEQLSVAKRVQSGRSGVTFDAKSGYLILAVPGHLVAKMQEALNRLDAPKEMVQIDLLLLERRVTDANRSGIQLLRLGAGASKTHSGGLNYSGSAAGGGPLNRGILDFFLSRAQRGHLPAYDLAYNFLISQEDVQIHANPSILTVNGVPASLNLVEETSLNTGMGRVERGTRYLQNTYIRAQYGIRIEITPSVQREPDGQFITLDADLRFDTRKASEDDRPDVHTRQVKTLVRVADGERVILGGLRQKEAERSRDSIPFLGDLPGIGKLFGTSMLIDRSTEMFLFITPKIISSSRPDDQQQLREVLMQRPGELPEFVERCRWAKRRSSRPSPPYTGDLAQVQACEESNAQTPGS